jgi:glycosyltransferase 2 family protein
MTAAAAERASAPGSDAPSRSRWKTLRRWLTPVFVVAVLGVAGYLIHQALTRYSWGEIVASVTSVPIDHIVRMGGFAAASYLCLTCFDAMAVRYVGRSLPYWRVGMTSFVALSIGHNVGFAALSSGAIRYRLYSQWGLSAAEVAKLVLFCALTVGLGLGILGGLALLLQPGLAQEITRLDRPIILALGTACMLVAAAYLVAAAFVRRPLRFRRWSLELPSLRLALGQTVVGPLNFAFVAACLYEALAASAEVTYLGVATVYVTANVATLLSHVPGGLGVIESVVLFLLRGQQVIGALILFRLAYFLVPLCIGSLLFVLIELLMRTGRRAKKKAAASDQPG